MRTRPYVLTCPATVTFSMSQFVAPLLLPHTRFDALPEPAVACKRWALLPETTLIPLGVPHKDAANVTYGVMQFKM